MIYSEISYADYRFNPPKRAADGTYRGYGYLVVDFGDHPCAYIRIPEDSPYYQKHYRGVEVPIEPHGGFSFSNMLYDRYFDKKNRTTGVKEGWYLGWDYCHADDYTVFSPHGKKYTTAEIEDEIKEVIDGFIKA